MIKRLLIVSCMFLVNGTALASAPQVDGLWRAYYVKSNTPSADTCVKTLADGTLEGRIKHVYPRPGEHPADKCVNCPGAEKNKPFEGIRVLWGMKPTGQNTWDSGELLDPETGKTYSGTMSLSKDGQELDMRGYILGMKFLGETEVWKRQPGGC